MKNILWAICGLTVLAAIADGIAVLQVRLNPWRLGGLFECLALILGAFVALTYSAVVKRLRHWVLGSAWKGIAPPLLLLIPYLVYALATRTFSLRATGTLAAYVVVPTLFLLPDRLRHAEQVGWRDVVAMLALAWPVASGWLGGLWTWPLEIYFFRPLVSVCAGGYAFLVVRNLDGVGYRLGLHKGDVVAGLSNLAGFALLAIPLGLALSFIRPHAGRASVAGFAYQAFGIYFSIAIPEELLFRGILQNLLVKSIRGQRRGLYGLVIASAIFGASHLHHPPVPNWRYAILATLAGMFYGNAYQLRGRISASALTHALVDTAWHFWF